MAEIKSTLELAMERTKRFTISGKEKEEMKQKESLQKAASLFYRYRDGHLSLNEILKEIERMDPASTTVKEHLLSQWIDALSLDEDGERILRGIESVKGRVLDTVKKKFHGLLLRYQAEKEKAKEMVGIQSREALRKDGISGSAVEPKLEGSGLWKKEKDKLDRSYARKLEEIKEELRAS